MTFVRPKEIMVIYQGLALAGTGKSQGSLTELSLKVHSVFFPLIKCLATLYFDVPIAHSVDCKQGRH